jgi:hypothetical protein
MPARKKAAKKAPKKAAAKKAAKKPNKKVSKSKIDLPKKSVSQKAVKTVEVEKLEREKTEVEEPLLDRAATVECEHCLGAGKCTAGEPYDKGHHQVFGSKLMLTSCFDCLEAAGEHHNSKKLVGCRICGGRGMVKA